MLIFKVPSEIVHADDAAARLRAPAFVGRKRRAAQVNDQIPFPARSLAREVRLRDGVTALSYFCIFRGRPAHQPSHPMLQPGRGFDRGRRVVAHGFAETQRL